MNTRGTPAQVYLENVPAQLAAINAASYPANYKAVLLMREAVEICECQSSIIKKPDLFAALDNPYHTCLNYFTTIVQPPEDQPNDFDPTLKVKEIKDVEISALSCAYEIHRKHGRQHPELNKFLELINTHYPEQLATAEEADTYEKDLKKQSQSITKPASKAYSYSPAYERQAWLGI